MAAKIDIKFKFLWRGQHITVRLAINQEPIIPILELKIAYGNEFPINPINSIIPTNLIMIS